MANNFLEERPYQIEAVNKALNFFRQGKNSVLIESPVGSGKTIMGLMVIKKMQEENPTLQVNYVASRRHILQQVDLLNRQFFNCNINLVSVFNSNPPKADLLILDEAHHEATQSCLAMYEHAGNKYTLGLSATPLRTDRVKLAFQENVACGSIRNFIKTGVLSPFHAYKIPLWNIELLTAIFCAEPEKWGKSIIFFNRIDECVTFCENLRRFGITCDVVTGSSNKDLQLENFASGQTQVIANVSVLSEGFDLPELQSVFIRNASRLPTIQMAGRGLRKSPTKTHCNIIQSIETKFDVEKIAEPEERFRFKRNQWLSCNGNTIPVVQTIERSLELLQNKSVKMPLYLQGGHRRICEVNLRDTMLKQYFSRY